MNTVTRHFTFEAAHRLMNHSGKCRFLHGHSYKVSVTIATVPDDLPLDEKSMVIDFGDLRQIIGSWIDDNLDHNTILNFKDPIVADEKTAMMVCGRIPFIMDYERDPTAEALSVELTYKFQYLLNGSYSQKRFKVTEVTVKETENCEATFR